MQDANWGPREEFKAAFLREATAAGLTIEETHGRVKTASGALTQGPGREKQAIVSQAWDAVKILGGIAGAGLLVGPLAAGAVGGAATGTAVNAIDTTEQDPETLKQQELIEAYRREAQRLKLQGRLAARRREVPAGSVRHRGLMF